MRLRTFTAPNMPAAMRMVRSAMGDEAIIISSESLNGSKMVSVTAAIDQDDEEIPKPKTNGHSNGHASHATDTLRFDLQTILRFHNVPELFVAKMMQQMTESELSSTLAIHRLGGQHNQRQLQHLAMETMLQDYFTFTPLLANKNDMRLMLVGPPGIGKTLTIAKLATKLSMDKQPLAVITTDNQRAGGIEQLMAFTSILGIELKIAASRTELLRHLKALPAKMRVLIDTAGCNAYDAQQLHELKGLTSLAGIEPVLAMQAGGDSMEMVDMCELFMELPIKRLLVTRADSTKRFGGILAAAAAHGLSFSHISNSPNITGALHAADAGLLAQLLLRYQLQSH